MEKINEARAAPRSPMEWALETRKRFDCTIFEYEVKAMAEMFRAAIAARDTEWVDAVLASDVCGGGPCDQPCCAKFRALLSGANAAEDRPSILGAAPGDSK